MLVCTMHICLVPVSTGQKVAPNHLELNCVPDGYELLLCGSQEPNPSSWKELQVILMTSHLFITFSSNLNLSKKDFRKAEESC